MMCREEWQHRIDRICDDQRPAVQEKALEYGPGGYGEQRTPKSEEVLPNHEHEHDEARMNLCRRADDLGVQEICFELVDSEHPKQSPKRSPKVLAQSNQNGWHRAEDRPKDR